MKKKAKKVTAKRTTVKKVVVKRRQNPIEDRNSYIYNFALAVEGGYPSVLLDLINYNRSRNKQTYDKMIEDLQKDNKLNHGLTTLVSNKAYRLAKEKLTKDEFEIMNDFIFDIREDRSRW